MYKIELQATGRKIVSDLKLGPDAVYVSLPFALKVLTCRSFNSLIAKYQGPEPRGDNL